MRAGSRIEPARRHRPRGRGLRLLGPAALARVFGPLAAPGAGESWLLASAALWSLAFAAFLRTCAPVLCRPRIDGEPGWAPRLRIARRVEKSQDETKSALL